MKNKRLFYIAVIFVVGCISNKKSDVKKPLVFTKTNSIETGIQFKNQLTETDSLNYFKYTSISSSLNLLPKKL